MSDSHHIKSTPLARLRRHKKNWNFITFHSSAISTAGVCTIVGWIILQPSSWRRSLLVLNAQSCTPHTKGLNNDLFQFFRFFFSVNALASSLCTLLITQPPPPIILQKGLPFLISSLCPRSLSSSLYSNALDHIDVVCIWWECQRECVDRRKGSEEKQVFLNA